MYTLEESITPLSYDDEICEELGLSFSDNGNTWYVTGNDYKRQEVRFYWSLFEKKLNNEQLFNYTKKIAILLSMEKKHTSPRVTKNHSLLTNSVGFSKRFILYANKYNKKSFSEWGVDDVKNYVLFITLNDFNTEQGFIKRLGPKCWGSVLKNVDQLNSLADLYDSGRVEDGVQVKLSLNAIKSVLKPILKDYGIAWGDYVKGGTWGDIPFHIANLWVAWCVQFIRSDEVQKAISINDLKYHIAGKYNKGELGNVKYSSVRNVINNAICNKGVTRKGTLSHKVRAVIENSNFIYDKKWYETLLNNNKDIHSPEKIILNKAIDCSLVILLSLSAFRISESNSIMRDSFIETKSGYLLDSRIEKTGFGFVSSREVGGLVAEAVKVIMKAVPTTENEQPLFCSVQQSPAKKWRSISKGRLALKVDICYQEFLKEVSDDFKKEKEKVSPHRLRHFFAEFAMRKFDGAVHEEIRLHFRYAPNSQMFKAYVSNKQNQKCLDYAEIDVIKDFVKRIGMEKHNGFSGPVANSIHRMVLDSQIVDPYDLEEMLEQTAENQFLSLHGHEHGYCLLRNDLINNAECKDENNKPNPGLAGQDTCLFCVNYLLNDAQVGNLERIAITHQSVVDSKMYGIKAKDQSKRIVQRIKDLLENHSKEIKCE